MQAYGIFAAIDSPTKEVSIVYRTGYVDAAYVRSDIVIGDLSDELILDVSIDDATFASNESIENWINNVSKLLS